VFEGRIAKGPALFGSAMSYLILSLDNCAKEELSETSARRVGGEPRPSRFCEYSVPK
jgi:hypothetical protein